MHAASDGRPDRWRALFADLDAQFAAQQQTEHAEEIAERLQYEIGQHTLVHRLRAARGDGVRIGFAGRDPTALVVGDVGPDWLLGVDESGPQCEWLVPLAAVCWVEGLGRRVDARDLGRVWAGFDLRRALRALARERATVSVAIDDLPWQQGTFVRIYADHVDLALHDCAGGRPAPAVRAARSVSLAKISAVRRLG